MKNRGRGAVDPQGSVLYRQPCRNIWNIRTELKESRLVPSGPGGAGQSPGNVRRTEGTRPDCHAVSGQSERNGPGMLTQPVWNLGEPTRSWSPPSQSSTESR